jgi:hypothetical protein
MAEDWRLTRRFDHGGRPVAGDALGEGEPRVIFTAALRPFAEL